LSDPERLAEARARLGSLFGDLPEEYMSEAIEAYLRHEPSLRRLPRASAMAVEPSHVFDPRKFLPRPGARSAS
jgi:hypothetical protein